MHKSALSILFFFLIHLISFSQDSTKLIPDKTINLDFLIGFPNSSATYTANFRSINRSIHYLMNDRIPWIKRQDGNQMFLKATTRFLKYALIDRQISFNMMLYNHEVFGHIASLNNLNYKISSYYQPIYLYLTRNRLKKLFDISYSFDNSNYDKTAVAAVSFNSNSNYNYHLNQRINLAASGVMAENLYHIDCQEQWAKNGLIPYSDATTYLETSLDNFGYLNLGSEYGYGGDIGSYLYHLNLLYNPTLYNNGNYSYENIVPLIPENFKIKSRDLKRANYISTFSDPNLIFSLLTIGNYIFRGKSYTKLPLLKLGNVKFMPALSLVLAPFGLEYNLRTPLVFPNKTMHLQFRYGEAYGINYYGLGFKISNIICKNNIVISPRLEVFFQPKMYFGNSKYSNEPFQEIGGNGLLADVLIQKKFISSPMYLNARIGYKTSGFVLGESLKATPIIQFGFGTELPLARKK
jgi:hypothetical protein